MMKKRMIADTLPDNEKPTTSWLDLEVLVDVEITSEDSDFPIEAALLANSEHGWRAGKPGAQTIRLLLKQPQNIQRIQLCFLESAVMRTQEYVLRWSKDYGQTYHEIVRQQWNFSPDGSSVETEEYTLALSGVTVLELMITPDISSKSAFASLEKLRIA
ncbi:carbohydrate-binding protein [Methylomicrobium sp. Wu6]|uniref:carbohydrate-binding protein n=1 Tax=Methylomicrobium sp. Wu6 TaxID=3107928 RepID=UPI002DD69997|nr:carbohydrate-binding protein [Methylomicrobium sp. Wu6]MEC4749791.1 carbohydrate-binding protein [Methylomicrobium sp. Wu6]